MAPERTPYQAAYSDGGLETATAVQAWKPCLGDGIVLGNISPVLAEAACIYRQCRLMQW